MLANRRRLYARETIWGDARRTLRRRRRGAANWRHVATARINPPRIQRLFVGSSAFYLNLRATAYRMPMSLSSLPPLDATPFPPCLQCR